MTNWIRASLEVILGFTAFFTLLYFGDTKIAQNIIFIIMALIILAFVASGFYCLIKERKQDLDGR
jgi:hypothetical protein